jgi:hypothetical protein
MRILGLTAVAVAVTAAVLVGPRPASAVPFSAMSLSPTSGPSTTSITARYVFQQQQGGDCEHETVTFSWEGVDLPGPVQISTIGGQGQRCVATLSFKPLSGLDGPGRHSVQGATGNAAQSKPFTITADTAPAPAPPTQGASPTATVSAPSTSTPPSQPAVRPSASRSTPASPSMSDEPLPSEEPTSDASPAIVGAAMKPPSGGSIATIVAIVVGAVTVAAAGFLIALVVRKRPDADEVPADAVPG